MRQAAEPRIEHRPRTLPVANVLRNVGAMAERQHWGARARAPCLREVIDWIESLRDDGTIETDEAGSGSDDGATGKGSRIKNIYSTVEELDRLFGRALGVAHAARERLEGLAIEYSDSGIDDSDGDPELLTYSLATWFPMQQQRDAIQWALNARRLTRTDAGSYRAFRHWEDVFANASYASLELTWAADEGASAATLARLRAKHEYWHQRDARLQARLKKTFEALFEGGRGGTDRCVEFPGAWGFHGVGFPLVPEGIDSATERSEWREIGASMSALGKNCRYGPETMNGAKAVVHEATRNWNALDDAGGAMILLGRLLGALGDDDAEHCACCFRYRARGAHCEMHKAKRDKHQREVYIAKRRAGDYLARFHGHVGVLDWAYPELPNILSAEHLLADIPESPPKNTDPDKTSLGNPAEALRALVGTDVAVELREAAIRLAHRRSETSDRAATISNKEFWQFWFAEVAKDVHNPAVLRFEDLDYRRIAADLIRYRAWKEAEASGVKIQKRTTPHTRAKMRALASKGHSYREIGDRLGFSRTAVMNAVRSDE